ncbi:MAG: GreA/GreB family elongation factor [Patescibacteria group bacterium]|nr:GreA/GreB family elongation factor [Patescibacteria group bacterium]
MEKTIPLSKLGYETLTRRQKELKALISRKKKPTIEWQRELNIAKSQLSEIESILEKGFVREFDEKNPAQVQIGSTVTLENLASFDKREYTILTRSTADPLKGIISNESPLAQKMLGLKLGNTFKFKDNYGQEDTYKIKNIE